MPLAVKLVGATVALALVFIAAAILGGGGSTGNGPIADAPAPPGGGAASEPTERAAEKLGFPSFATNNTTRVGGSEAAANAAGVALAAYPSTTAPQRPAAVTLVDSDDWQTAIAAAVLMAAPVQAPVLVSGADELPEPTSEALAALAPSGYGTRRTQAFAIGGATAPSDLKTAATGGAGPAGAAAVMRLRDRLFGKPPRHIVVTPAAGPGFAMPAAAWAARSGDPVLFAGKDKLPAPTASALRRHSGVPVYVLGPSSAISSRVVRQIAETGHKVRRVSGEDPVASAIALARYDGDGFGWNVNDPGHGFVVARSEEPLDAAAAAPLSASGTWGPLLLTDNADRLPPALRDYLLDVKPGYTTNPTRAFYNHVWVIGDQDAIGVGQQAAIDELAELTKIGGEP